MDQQLLRAEARRVYHRYVTEVVEAFGLCPWARRARMAGKVRLEVMLQIHPAPRDLVPCLDSIAADSNTDIGVLLFPRVGLDRHQFRRFVGRLREYDADRYPPGRAPLLMADFHPHAEPDMNSPERLVSFIRRTPDPTVQLLRSSVVHAARNHPDHGTVAHSGAILASLARASGCAGRAADHKPLHQQVAEENHATIARFGVDQLRAILDDIRRDRDRSYATVDS